MNTARVLLEVTDQPNDAFSLHAAAAASDSEAERQGRRIVDIFKLTGLGLELDEDGPPVPLFADESARTITELASTFEGFRSSAESPDRAAKSMVFAVTLPSDRMDEVRSKPGVKLWPNSRLTLFNEEPSSGDDLISEAVSRGGVDCRPFRPAASIATIRTMLGARRLWEEGFRGQGLVVGIIDEGVDGDTYPVTGGFALPNAGRRPGGADVDSHGSMCAADVLIAAPAARIYDYPFLGDPRSGGALTMFHAVLEQRRLDGTPQLTNNSYGFVGVPDKDQNPNHEIHDLNHPLHRKIREVVASGASALFSAGNCGEQCPSGNCHVSGIGPGNSIHGSNSLDEVITVAAVNRRHERVGYSSQGPGMFEPNKPDVAGYTHIFANFGPGRPAGGGSSRFDNGTSAATPVVAGVAALLLSAFPDLTPAQLKDVLIRSATSLGNAVGFDFAHGHGVVNAAAAYNLLRHRPPLTS